MKVAMQSSKEALSANQFFDLRNYFWLKIHLELIRRRKKKLAPAFTGCEFLQKLTDLPNLLVNQFYLKQFFPKRNKKISTGNIRGTFVTLFHSPSDLALGWLSMQHICTYAILTVNKFLCLSVIALVCAFAYASTHLGLRAKSSAHDQLREEKEQ